MGIAGDVDDRCAAVYYQHSRPDRGRIPKLSVRYYGQRHGFGPSNSGRQRTPVMADISVPFHPHPERVQHDSGRLGRGEQLGGDARGVQRDAHTDHRRPPSGASYAYADGLPTAQFTYKLSNSLGYSVNSLYLSGCTVSGSGVSASVTTDPGTAFFYVSYTAASTSQPGTYSVTCTYLGMSIQGATISVYDASPTITEILPNPVSESSLPQSVAFVGYGFGAAPPALTISPSLAYTILPGNSPTYFVAQILAPAAGRYSISVTSTGNNSALGFQAGGSPPSAPRGGPTVLTVTAVKPVIQGFETQTGVPSNPGPNAPVDAQSQGFLELFGVGFTNAGAVATPLVKITRPSGTAWTCGATQVAGSPCWLEYISDTQINAQYTFSTSPVAVGSYGITVTTSCNGASCGISNVWNFSVVPAILFNGVDVTGLVSQTAGPGPTNVVVGQQVVLTGVAPLPPGLAIQSQSWTAPGTTLQAFSVASTYIGQNLTDSVGKVVPAVLTANPTTLFWVDAAYLRIVTYSAQLSNGSTISSSTAFNVYGPTTPGAVPELGMSQVNNTPALVLDGVASFNGIGVAPTAGYLLGPPVTPPVVGDPGTVSFIQTVTANYYVNNNPAVPHACPYGPGIDTSYPYDNLLVSKVLTVVVMVDKPLITLTPLPGYNFISARFQAVSYLMWTSNLPNATAVPLGSVTWYWNGDAAQQNGVWALNPNGENAPGALPFVQAIPSVQPNQGYPTWSAVVNPAVQPCNYTP